ncbi:MAG: glycosyltransferase family 4 protein [Clostridia bacterium]|nr:glycosyltransferase family 4 protein [Deltaproteobacteria bacterium]
MRSALVDTVSEFERTLGEAIRIEGSRPVACAHSYDRLSRTSGVDLGHQFFDPRSGTGLDSSGVGSDGDDVRYRLGVSSRSNARLNLSGAEARRASGTHIAMIAPCPFPSHQGTQVFLRHLANALVADGYELSFFAYASAEQLEEAFLDDRIELVRAGGRDVGTRSGPSWGRIAGDGALLRRTWTQLRRERPDILHVHNAEGLALGVLLKRMLGVSLVFHAHNVLAHELPHYVSGKAAKRVVRAAAAIFDRSLPRLADAVICFDARQAAHYASLGVATRRLHVIPLGLDHDELGEHPIATFPTPANEPAHARKYESNALSHAPLIVYAGNPDAYQNPDLIRETIAALRRRCSRSELRIVSNHPADAFGQLAHAPGVYFRSFRGPRELASLIAEADAGLCARTLWTGAPVKILSYVSVGVPVVACGKGATMLAEFPDAGLCTEADPEALADGLLKVVTNRSGFDVSRMRAATHIKAHTRAYQGVYAAVLRDSLR